MSTILFLTPRFPWPLIGGDRVKAYHLLRHLGKRHRVHVVTFSHGAPPTDIQRRKLEELGVELHVVPLDPLRAGMASIRTFWTGLPLEITFYTRPDFKRVVDDILAHENVDLAISFFMRTAEYVRDVVGLPKILIAEDCRLEYQTRSTLAARTLPQKLVRWWETRKLRRYEPAVVNDFDLTTFVSPEDVAAMEKLNRSASYHVVTNGVDLDRFSFRDDHERRSGLLFAGKLDVLANHLMAGTIIRDIMPVVHAAVPDTELIIAGASPKAALQRMAGPHIGIEADVPDLVPYLHRAAIFIHPHHGGSGIQNKVLEAMAAGCAVVTTPSGLQGIGAVHGTHVLVGTAPEELARHVIRLLKDAGERSILARNARTLMMQTHSWDHVFSQLDRTIAGVTGEMDSDPDESSVPLTAQRADTA